MGPLMYERFFGLRERPFDLTPNPRFLFLTPKHEEALSNLRYGIGSGKGMTVLVGEAGTGKTTLVHAALDSYKDRDARVVYLNNPTLTRQEFFELVAQGLDLSAEAAASKSRFLVELGDVLRKRQEAGAITTLVIDEAQQLSDGLLEEVRLLANLETPTQKLLPVVLIGQPELSDRLNQTSLRQLKQRVALRCVLRPLDLRETGCYIANRIRIAGGESVNVFTREAVLSIFEHSGGIPRVISVICDNALITAFAADQRPVRRDMILDVCRDFDLLSSASHGGNGNGAAIEHQHVKPPSPIVKTQQTSAPAPAAVSKPPSRFRFSFFESF